MEKSIFTTLIATIAIAVSGCSSTSPSSAPTISTKASAPTISTSTSNGVIGYGATSDAWDAHHVADLSGNFAPGCCYNADHNLASWIGTDRYTTVSRSNGIVTSYNLGLPEGTKLKEAKIAALAELPSDAKITFFYAGDKSATLEVTSALLRPILMDPSIGSPDGSVDFVFCSVANDGTTSYNPANINSIYVNFGMGLDSAKGTAC